MTLGEPCPCGTGAAYGACCGPLHDGMPAPTAERLMRSRYSAYALGLDDYLVRTWHPRTRPADLPTNTGIRWVGLEIGAVVDGGEDDETGTVAFTARFRNLDGEHALRETSRFERRASRWVYVDGDVT